MPPLEELTEPVATTGRTIGLLVLRGYLIFAAVLTTMMGTFMDYFIGVMHDLMPRS